MWFSRFLTATQATKRKASLSLFKHRSQKKLAGDFIHRQLTKRHPTTWRSAFS